MNKIEIKMTVAETFERNLKKKSVLKNYGMFQIIFFLDG